MFDLLILKRFYFGCCYSDGVDFCTGCRMRTYNRNSWVYPSYIITGPT